MIDSVSEQEALKKFKDAIPNYLIGECINAAMEMPPMTTLTVKVDSSGHIHRKGRKVEIVEGPIEVSFDFHRDRGNAVDDMYGRVVHTGNDFEIRVMGYNPMVVMAEPL